MAFVFCAEAVTNTEGQNDIEAPVSEALQDYFLLCVSTLLSLLKIIAEGD